MLLGLLLAVWAQVFLVSFFGAGIRPALQKPATLNPDTDPKNATPKWNSCKAHTRGHASSLKLCGVTVLVGLSSCPLVKLGFGLRFSGFGAI